MTSQRTPQYEKSTGERSFLEQLHKSTTDLDVSLSLRTPHRLSQPIIFVVGAPRSGTTILAQAIAYCYKIGYITNIAARFWGAPLVGIDLSHAVLGYDPAGDMGTNFFRSKYGRTVGGGGLHEFGYFWKGWLDNTGRPLSGGMIADLCNYVAMIQNCLGTPIVMKGAMAAMYQPTITRALGEHNVKWVYIERGDTIRNCISILDARRAYFGNDHMWFGHGYEFSGLRSDLRLNPKVLGPYGEIAGQVLELRKYYGSMATHTVLLSQLWEDPMKALEGILPELVRKPPKGAMTLKPYESRPDDEAAFLEAIKRYCE